ncbi:MAG: DedA family protein [Planctomycetes bacterium]|nr:DedA family protein [Planctomycetota bacterium]
MNPLHLLSAAKNWVLEWAATPLAPLVLFANAVAEAILFPVPPDLLLIAMCLAAAAAGKAYLCFVFAFITTAGSVTGGVIGYSLGLKGGRPIAQRLYAKEKIAAADRLYAKYGIWAVAVAGFTPVPYCIFTVLSGVLRLKLHKFVVVSALSRGARFFLVATLISIFGKTVARHLENEKVFGLLTITFMVLLVGGYFLLHRYSRRHIRRVQTAAEVPGDNSARGSDADPAGDARQ